MNREPATMEAGRSLSESVQRELLSVLKDRFEKNMQRHKGILWDEVKSKFEADPAKVWSLSEMERTGGEPDVVGYDRKSGKYLVVDCSPESPGGRRNTCYDREGQDSREKKGIHPGGNAIDMAAAMGIELLTEEQYRDIQKLGEFDLKTSSWIKTPQPIRKLGGALFADRRYNTVFVYHNSAPSFYSARGFRGFIYI